MLHQPVDDIDAPADSPQCNCHGRWIRLPSKGYEHHSGLSPSHIYQLISGGKSKSAVLTKPGKLRGVRLVWLPSLLDYIERHVVTPGEGHE